MIIEFILIALCWGVQMGITAVIALAIGGIVQGIEQRIRRKKVKLLPRAAVAMVLVCAVLAAFALNFALVALGELIVLLVPGLAIWKVLKLRRLDREIFG